MSDWKDNHVNRPIPLQLDTNQAWLPDQECTSCGVGRMDYFHGIRVLRGPSGWLCAACGHKDDSWTDDQVIKPEKGGFITVQAHINGSVSSNPFLNPPRAQWGSKQAPDYEDRDAFLEAGLTDLGNSRRLVMEHGDKFRWVSEFREFLVYDGFRWNLDRTHAMERYAARIIDIMHLAAVSELGATTEAGKKLLQHAMTSASGGKIEAMIKLSRSDPKVVMRPDDFDRDAHLLNCKAGSIDLRTGMMQPHIPTEYMTKLVPVWYEMEADCSLWHDFVLTTVANGDEELADWIQKAVGYTITGENREQCFFFMYGDGANGKSVFLDVISQILDDYSTTASFDLFLKGSRDNIEHGLATLLGVRMATAIEAPQGRSWNESLLKTVTGGDAVRASRKYQNSFEFKPIVKLWFAANTRPVIQGRDKGIWRRFIPIPCRAHIPKEDQDRELTQKLLAEKRGILAWMVRGAVRYYEEGLEPLPKVIEESKADYMDANDIFGRFVSESARLEETGKEGYATSSGVILSIYNDWAKQNGEKTINNQVLSEMLANFRGGILKKERGAGGRYYWYGIDVFDPNEDDRSWKFTPPSP